MNPIVIRPADTLLVQPIVEDHYTLFPYFLTEPSARPLIWVLPGGGYHHWALEKEGKNVARWLNSLGYHAVVLTYPVKQSIIFSQIKEQLVELNERIQKQWRDILGHQPLTGIIGFSAGAHLSALAANLLPDIFRFSLLCYPVVSFEGTLAHDGSVRNFLGVSASAKEKHWFSTDQRVTSQTGPTFLWHTANDQSVSVANTLQYGQALAKAKVPFECHIFPDGPHGLGLALDSDLGKTWTQLAAQWLANVTS